MRIELEVNGESHSDEIAPGKTLLAYLRDDLGLRGSKEACGRGECGACTVLVGDVATMSCAILAGQVSAPVTTIEGLATSARDVREGFADHHGFQCGFCTSGQIVRAESVLRAAAGRGLTTDDIVGSMTSNICRCTGYAQIVDAVAAAARGRGLLREAAES